MKSLYLYMLEAVGEFGPWQARRVAVIWVFMVVLGILQKTENRMYYCEYPGCQSYTVGSFTNTTWLEFIFPRYEEFSTCKKVLGPTKHSKFDWKQFGPARDYCLINIPNIDEKGLCSWGEDQLQSNWTFSCPPGPGNHFRYPENDREFSAITRFGILCDQKLGKFHMIVARCCGSVIGSAAFYFITSSYGRICGILYSLLAISLAGLGMLVEVYEIFLFCYALRMFGWYALIQNCYLYIHEIIGSQKRVFKSISWFSYDSLICMSLYLPRASGEILMYFFISKFDLKLDQLALVDFIIPLMSIIFLSWMPESPKWLLSRYRLKEAQTVLNDMTRVNGKEMVVELKLGNDDDTSFPDHVTNKDVKVKFGSREGMFSLEQTPYSFFALFNINLIQYTVCFIIIYFLIPMNKLASRGLREGSGDYNLGIVEICGIIFTMVIEGILGRANCLFIYTNCIFLVAILSDLVHNAHPNLYGPESECRKIEILWYLQNLIRFMAAPLFSLVYIMALNIFPTSLRHPAYAVFWSVLSIGNTLHPMFVEVLPFLTAHGPYFWLGMLSFFCSIFCYYLPEPLNYDPPEIMEDTVFMSQRRSKLFPFRASTRRKLKLF